MRVPEWFAWASGIASIVGGIASLGVFVAALLWRRMARRLLSAVRIRSLADELVRLQAAAARLMTALQSERFGEARAVVSVLRTDVHTVLGRQRGTLAQSDLVNLGRVRDLARQVEEALPVSGAPDPGVSERATRRVQECGDLLAEALGHAQAGIDTTAGEAQ